MGGSERDRLVSLATTATVVAATFIVVACAGGASSNVADSGAAGADGIAPDSGAGDADSADLDSSGGASCVDIRVTPQLLPSVQEWGDFELTIPGASWRVGSALQVAWRGMRISPDDGGGSVARPWLVISSFDCASGALGEQSAHDVFPASSTSQTGAIPAAVMTGSGMVDALVVHATPTPSEVDVALWSATAAGVPSPSSVEVLQAFTGVVWHVGWDGQATVVHGYNVDASSNLRALATRIGPNGEILLPPTWYGGVAKPGAGDYIDHLSTSPVSGITYHLGASGAVVLSGHYRDGTQLPGMVRSRPQRRRLGRARRASSSATRASATSFAVRSSSLAARSASGSVGHRSVPFASLASRRRVPSSATTSQAPSSREKPGAAPAWTRVKRLRAPRRQI